MTMWLVSSAIRDAFQRAEKAGATPSATQQLDYEARAVSGDTGDAPRLLTVAGNNAEVAISGVITNRPDLMAFLFGGGNTTYGDINSALMVAEQDPDVDNISLLIDSPGGSFDGLFDTLAVIQSVTKPVKAIVSNTASSAAFAIAAQADTIAASNRAARVGSVGVVVTLSVSDSKVDIASTNAPKKRPDVTTAEGQAIVREELDALHEIFVESIAEGRGTTVEDVNANFGQGATLLAEEALKRGMIDAVEGTPLTVVASTESTTTASTGGNLTENGPMDRQTLKAQHPDVYATVMEEGVTQERDRVAAHLTMGEASGDMKTAVGAINEGSIMTASLQATYMAAGMNRSDISSRQDDDVDADAGDGASAAKEDVATQEAASADGILNAAADICGVEVSI